MLAATLIFLVAAPIALARPGALMRPSETRDEFAKRRPSGCVSSTRLFVGAWNPPRIECYCVAADGMLSFVGVQPAPGDARDLQVGREGHRLYYAHSGLSTYEISDHGELALLGTRSASGGSFDDLTLGPEGRFLYGTHSGGRLHVYDTWVGTHPYEAQVVSGLVSPRGVAPSSSGDALYVANQWTFLGDPDAQQEIVTFQRGPDGRLNDEPGAVGHTQWLDRPDYFAVHPTLPMLYHTDRSGGAVVSARIEDGGLVPSGSTFSGLGAARLAMNVQGDRLYVVNSDNRDLSVFEIDDEGQLLLLQVQATAGRPEDLVLHPSRPFLYVAGSNESPGQSRISVFLLRPDGLMMERPHAALLQPAAHRLAIVQLEP
jgi:6-phosphogluconolactonase (cycloisomerase 2 family)